MSRVVTPGIPLGPERSLRSAEYSASQSGFRPQRQLLNQDSGPLSKQSKARPLTPRRTFGRSAALSNASPPVAKIHGPQHSSSCPPDRRNFPDSRTSPAANLPEKATGTNISRVPSSAKVSARDGCKGRWFYGYSLCLRLPSSTNTEYLYMMPSNKPDCRKLWPWHLKKMLSGATY